MILDATAVFIGLVYPILVELFEMLNYQNSSTLKNGLKVSSSCISVTQNDMSIGSKDCNDVYLVF